MKLTTDQIIKLLQVPGLGKSKIFKFAESLTYFPNNDRDLLDLLLESSVGLKININSVHQVLEAFGEGEKLLERSERHGIKILSFYDHRYPPQLKNISSPPIIINCKGDVTKLVDMPTVAVIGTRSPSAYGRQIAERIGFRLGERRVNVVSGLALGCDAGAHVGCLKANGITTAVLAHGLDVPTYPKENRKLAEKIIEMDGCLVSEYLVTTRGLPNYFIERDRIQAGLSKATIVVETDIKGGTMHTVKNTLEYGRFLAVFKHPLEKRNEKSRGNESILADGKSISLVSKEDIDALIDLVDPPSQKEKVQTITKHEISEIQLPLYNAEEYDQLFVAQEKLKKPRKTKKKKGDIENNQIKVFKDEHNL